MTETGNGCRSRLSRARQVRVSAVLFGMFLSGIGKCRPESSPAFPGRIGAMFCKPGTDEAVMKIARERLNLVEDGEMIFIDSDK